MITHRACATPWWAVPTLRRAELACYNDGMKDPHERTAVLTSTPTETEAAIVVAALEENGIRAETDEYTSGLRAGAWNWVNIMVAEDDLVRAKEIFEQVQRENDHINWSQVDVGEPEED
jgi:Putative prokaryotic signal transducing protein